MPSGSSYSEKKQRPLTASSLNSKGLSHLEKQLLLGHACPRVSEVPLMKYQNRKWENVFDYDKMLKLLRNSEKQLKNKNIDPSALTADSLHDPKSSSSDSPPKKASCTSTTAKYSLMMKQVKRLNSNDMHYYGIAPKQETLELVHCKACKGVYTKVGFNNHMMLQHPSIWSTVPNKLDLEAFPPPPEIITPKAQEKKETATKDADSFLVPLPPSECSKTPYVLPANYSSSRHKSSKSSSSGGSSSRSRSRSKNSKHHSSSSSSHSSALYDGPSTSSGITHTSGKSSKRSSHSHSSKVATAINSNLKLNASNLKVSNTNSKENISSTYIPPSVHSKHVKDITPVSAFSATSAATNSSSAHSTSKVTYKSSNEVTHSLSDSKSLTKSTDKGASPISSPKKKQKNPTTFLAPAPSADTNSSHSKSDYDRTSSKNTEQPTNPTRISNANSSNKSSTPSTSGKHFANNPITSSKNRYDSQLSELDRAVSSITVGQENKNEISASSSSACMDIEQSVLNSNLTATVNAFQVPSTTDTDTIMLPATTQYTTAAAIVAPAAVAVEPMQITENEEVMPIQNTSTEDASMLSFEEMLDSKFINEILNNTETDINFDEQELATSTSQQPGSFTQAPASKRMRYDELTGMSATNTESHHHHQQPMQELAGEFAIYQPPQPNQQFTHYNTTNNVDENLKFYNTDVPYQTHFNRVLQPQQHAGPNNQNSPMDAMQLQQYLYHQQGTYAAPTVMADTSATLQQQQYNQSGVIDTKQIMDLCTEDVKDINAINQFIPSSNAMNHTNYVENVTDIDSQTSTTAINAQFQLYNIPSITDDPDGTADSFMPNSMNNSMHSRVANHFEQQRNFNLSNTSGSNGNEQHMYEFATNNGASSMNQHNRQPQQTVLTQYLNQSGYSNVEDRKFPTSNMSTSSSTATKSTTNWEDAFHDLIDFDFSKIETVKMISSSSESRHFKSEHHASASSKCNEDISLNVFLYAGIPRPLSINCFGFVKLPLSGGITFRKDLLSARKTNNNPMSLGGCLNGVAVSGSNVIASTSASRFTSSKITPNLYSLLPNVANSSTMSNETSNTNSPIMPEHTFVQPTPPPPKDGTQLDTAFNPISSTLVPTGNPVSSILASAQKSRLSLGSEIFDAISNKNDKTGLNSKSFKNAITTSMERLKSQRRNFSSKTDGKPMNFQANFTSTDLVQMFSMGRKVSTDTSCQTPMENSQDCDTVLDENLKYSFNPANRFFERRQKLLSSTYSSSQAQQQPQTPELQQESMFKQMLHNTQDSNQQQQQPPAQYIRNISDCNISNPGSNIVSLCKSSPNGNNDLMSVFV